MPITKDFKWPIPGQEETLRAVSFDWGPGFHFLSSCADLSGQLAQKGPSNTDDGWVIICPPSAYVAPKIKSAILRRSTERPDIELFYADDIDLSARLGDATINNKPDFDATLLGASDYIGPSIIVRSRAFYSLLGIDAPSQIFDVYNFVLRACAAGVIVGRIAQVLFAYSEPIPSSNRAKQALALNARVERSAPCVRDFPGRHHLDFAIGTKQQVRLGRYNWQSA
jgi:hypothetical protein